MLINENRFLETVQIGGAIWTRLQMFLDCLAFRRIDMFIQVATDMFGDIEAVNLLEFHDIMYPLSCSRRNTLARLSRDFTAGTDSLSIFETSSAD